MVVKGSSNFDVEIFSVLKVLIDLMCNNSKVVKYGLWLYMVGVSCVKDLIFEN